MSWWEKKKELNEETKLWNKELDEKKTDEEEKGKLMNQNYKAHIGKTADEQRDELNIKDKCSPRGYWDEEQLSREKRLESEQRKAWKDKDDAKEAISEAKDVIKNKKKWW